MEDLLIKELRKELGRPAASKILGGFFEQLNDDILDASTHVCFELSEFYEQRNVVRGRANSHSKEWRDKLRLDEEAEK
jgi:hypothetical protein